MRLFSRFLGLAFLATVCFSQISCGMLMHNVNRLMRIPTSILGAEADPTETPATVPANGDSQSLIEAPSPDLGPPPLVKTA